MCTLNKKVGALMLTPALTAVMLLGGMGSASATSGIIELRSENSGFGKLVDWTDDRRGQQFRPAKNDEAESMVLRNVRSGAVITVFDEDSDNPTKRESDDYAVITVKVSQGWPGTVVHTFERDYEDYNVKVDYHKRKGGGNLDGKVSRVHVD